MQPGTKGFWTQAARIGAAAAVAALAVTLALRTRSELGLVYAGAGRPKPDPAPVLTPARALRSLQTAEPLDIQLAAAEPMIEAPVAGQFDEDGRLWLVEMPTYMRDLHASGEMTRGNRIVVLEDVDGDGVFDRSTVFLDGLMPPRGVAPCFGGALVLEPPNLYFCKDTDGDGRADVKKLLLTGIGVGENPEHAGNGLIRGLDNWYHLSQDKLEFRFDGEKVVTRPTPVVGQWGLGQDDFGRLYYTPNSNPLLADVYPKHYLSRNRAMNGAPGIGEDIDKDATTWPAHPTPGVNRGYLDTSLRPDKTLASLTAACGTVVYRAGDLGEALRGSVFICEAAGNLVKRLTLRDDDGLPRAENAYRNTEFLRSTDERFRPVNLVVGPDGALYVIDMYRGLIQHKTYVTPYLAKQVVERGLETPLMLGRIYRVAGKGPARKARRLSTATDSELVALLGDPDGWWRDTAQRLLIERRAAGSAARIRLLAEHNSSPAVRVSALWTLEGLGQLSEVDVATAVASRAPGVARNACQMAEDFRADPGMAQSLAALCDDGDRSVRIQAAASLGEFGGTPEALVHVLRSHADDRYMRGAVLSGLAGREASAIGLLARGPGQLDPRTLRGLIGDLADVMLRGSDQSRSDLIDLVAGLAAQRNTWIDGAAERIRKAQRLDSDDPRPLALAREPASWIAASQEKSDQGSAMQQEADYFDWPGRPPVARKVKLREMTRAEAARFAKGRELYNVCQGCHQPDGSGSVGMAPPLAGSAIVQGNPERLARVLLHGMEGPYTMAEMQFTGVMVPAPFTTDEEIASVMTFVRRSWGNTGDPVDSSLVRQVRSANQRVKPWTRSEIEALK
jgi:mono/diheme cytochrome c family protein/glucose/arabinose dehydrogenase